MCASYHKQELTPEFLLGSVLLIVCSCYCCHCCLPFVSTCIPPQVFWWGQCCSSFVAVTVVIVAYPS